jgi:hypothetical protein
MRKLPLSSEKNATLRMLIQDEVTLRKLVQAADNESTETAVRRVVDELIEWRGACEAAFGIVTATPRKTLVELAIAQRSREYRAWNTALIYAPEVRHVVREELDRLEGSFDPKLGKRT